MNFTLDQLALFDRCLFPEDFKNNLRRVGAADEDASAVYWFIVGQRRKEKPCGIIQLYQEFITSNELTQHIERVVADFFKMDVADTSTN